MIEVELKLKVVDFPDLSTVEMVVQKNILDIYYDTADYKLISTGNFLRNRNNNKVDFKLNIGDLSHSYCKETRFDYKSFCPNKSLEEIFAKIGASYNPDFVDFDSFLKANKLSPLAIIDKDRKVYQIDDLVISLDEVKGLGKFMEIEKDLPDDAVFDKNIVRQEMLNKLASKHLLPKFEFVNIGYVELYLLEYNKVAYNKGLYKV